MIEIEVDETHCVFNTCEGCLDLAMNDTPNTRDTKPIKVLSAYGADEPLNWYEIQDLILNRGLKVKDVIEAVSGIDKFALIGLRQFDRSIKYFAQERRRETKR